MTERHRRQTERAAGVPRWVRREDASLVAQAAEGRRQQRISHLVALENQFDLAGSFSGQQGEEGESAEGTAALVAQHSPEGRGVTPEGALRGVVIGLPRREP